MATKTRATIRQVATLSGVSTSTVSNLLNGRIDTMTPATRERIEEAIRTLDYRPSHSARSLARRQTSTIGVIIDEINTSLFMSAVGAIEQLARGAHYGVIVGHASAATNEGEALDLLLEKDIDGLIFVSTSEDREDDHLAELAKNGPPTVLVNRPQHRTKFSGVGWDNRSGVRDAVKHLYSLGHRRIAHLRGPDNRYGTTERVHGYRLGLQDCDLEVRDDYSQVGDYTASSSTWAAATRTLLALTPPPTAIIAADDSVAAVAMQTATAQGLKIPEDIAFVGIDDQVFADFLIPPLTTLKLPVAEAAQTAFRMLLKHIQDPEQPLEQVSLPLELIVRKSCGATQAQDTG